MIASTLFFTRIYEICKFKVFVKSRVTFYGIVQLVPNVLSLIYSLENFNKVANQLDVKYSDVYYEKYLKVLDEEKQGVSAPKGQKVEPPPKK